MGEQLNLDTQLDSLLEKLEPITLEQMSEIHLMNRTDTKFVTTKERLMRLLELCQGHYFAQFHNNSKIANYRTTYWDTDEHFFFFQHHNGRSPRQKVRVRTYMDSDDTFLEIKTKNNHGRTNKKRISVPGQKINIQQEVQPGKVNPKMVTTVEGMDAFIQGLTHKSLSTLNPTVQNNFHRITLVNYGKTERLTIDFDILFHNFETGCDGTTGNLVIVELKRDGNVYSPILKLLRELRIKPHGFSKYCIGTCLTNSGIKQNLFKPKLKSLEIISRHH